MIEAQPANSLPRFELGIIVGEPTGLSAKWWISTQSAIDLAAAWSFSEHGTFELDADYLLHYITPELMWGKIPLYAGLGASTRIGNEWLAGARFPVGVEVVFASYPLTLFGEITPQWQILPDDKFVIGGGVGVRIKFGSIE